MKFSTTLYSRCRPGRQDKESVEQQQQGGYDRYEEQQLWEKVDEELFVCKQPCICLIKNGCLIVYLVDGLKHRKRAFRRIFRNSYLYCDARWSLFWAFVCHLVFVMGIGTYCFECWFFYWQKKVSAIKGQWSDTWLQAMVWNTRLGARRSQVGREEGPQLRQKQELLIFSTIDSLQRSYNNWQHACVIFPIRENMYHGVKHFFLLWSWIYFIYVLSQVYKLQTIC